MRNFNQRIQPHPRPKKCEHIEHTTRKVESEQPKTSVIAQLKAAIERQACAYPCHPHAVVLTRSQRTPAYISKTLASAGAMHGGNRLARRCCRRSDLITRHSKQEGTNWEIQRVHARARARLPLGLSLDLRRQNCPGTVITAGARARGAVMFPAISELNFLRGTLTRAARAPRYVRARARGRKGERARELGPRWGVMNHSRARRRGGRN